MTGQEELYRRTLELLEDGKRFAVLTLAQVEGSSPRHGGSKMLLTEDGETLGTIGGGALEHRALIAAKEAMRYRENRTLEYDLSGEDEQKAIGMICGGKVQVLIEVPVSKPHLFIVGAGHVGLALFNLARQVGFKLTVIDSRPDVCNAERFPGAEILCGPVDEVSSTLAGIVKPSSFVTIHTHGHKDDHAFLSALAEKELAYLGMIGSRRKVSSSIRKLRLAGVPDETIKKIRAPIGLDIGAETPEEIAVSIMAEMLMVRSGKGDGRSLRERLEE